MTKILILLGLVVTLTYSLEDCLPTEFACRSNNRCIPRWNVCDGIQHCNDRSDEESCPIPCRDEDEFTCETSKRCIPKFWECDNVADCEDASDEKACFCEGFKCPVNQICLPSSYVCDGNNDCGGYEDEVNCANCTAMAGFECPVTKMCIPRRLLCDGWDDCTDGGDESENLCPCQEDEFRCDKLPGSNTPGRCIPEKYVCDEDFICDCADCSDETNCNRDTWKTNSWREMTA